MRFLTIMCHLKKKKERNYNKIMILMYIFKVCLFQKDLLFYDMTFIFFNHLCPAKAIDMYHQFFNHLNLKLLFFEKKIMFLKKKLDSNKDV